MIGSFFQIGGGFLEGNGVWMDNSSVHSFFFRKNNPIAINLEKKNPLNHFSNNYYNI